MSQQLSNPQQQPVQKRKFDVYTMMLIVAFLAIVTACVLLAYELNRWGSYPWWNTSDAQPASVMNWIDGEVMTVKLLGGIR